MREARTPGLRADRQDQLRGPSRVPARGVSCLLCPATLPPRSSKLPLPQEAPFSPCVPWRGCQPHRPTPQAEEWAQDAGLALRGPPPHRRQPLPRVRATATSGPTGDPRGFLPLRRWLEKQSLLLSAPPSEVTLRPGLGKATRETVLQGLEKLRPTRGVNLRNARTSERYREKAAEPEPPETTLWPPVPCAAVIGSWVSAPHLQPDPS